MRMKGEARAESFAIRYIKHHPVRTVLLWPRKLVGLYASDVDGFYYSLGAMRAAWAHQAFVYLGFRIFGELYYLFLLTLAGIGMYSVLCRPSQGGGKIGIYLILYGCALIVMVRFAPQGLVGWISERWRLRPGFAVSGSEELRQHGSEGLRGDVVGLTV